jgi:hypothetical protein
MGYLIQNIDIIKTTVTIPSADVQVMDSTAPITIVNTNNLFFALPIACFIAIGANQTTQYSGFNHIHLSNSGSFAVGRQVATYSANASSTNDLINGLIYSMLINFQASPNRFGGLNSTNSLDIAFDTLPTAGDGDMIVTLYYTRITI